MTMIHDRDFMLSALSHGRVTSAAPGSLPRRSDPTRQLHLQVKFKLAYYQRHLRLGVRVGVAKLRLDVLQVWALVWRQLAARASHYHGPGLQVR
jgi:hypothetical protein